MNPTAATPGSPPQNSGRPARRVALDLQTLVLAAIAAVLVMSLGVNLFLYKQMRSARQQLTAARSLVQNLSDQYQAKEPAMRQFVITLQSFAAAHPEFEPVIQRYRIALPQFFNEMPVARPSQGPARDPVPPAKRF